MKRFPLFLSLLLVAAALISCGESSGTFENSQRQPDMQTDASDQDNNSNAGQDQILIGFSFGTLQEERWEKEKEALIELSNEVPNVDFIYTDANHDANLQNSQVESLITRGIDVLIIAPQDVKRASIACAMADRAGIPVISYIRLVKSENVDLHIGYDFYAIGKLNAQAAVSRVPSGKYVLMNGHAADSVPQLENQGYMDVLRPFVNAGQIQIVFNQFIPDWSPDGALKNMETILAKYTDVDVVLSNNDGMAGGVCQAIENMTVNHQILVLGMDGDLAACRRIAEGKQLSTILIGQKQLAGAAFNAATELAQGKIPGAVNARVDNEFGNLPAIYLQPEIITQENLYDLIIKTGVHPLESVYQNIPQSQWPRDLS